MEYGELIHNFVDGTLDSSQESSLFSELASNDSLRGELKQFIEFERTARFDTDAYHPSAETTSNIFSRVGISNPAFEPNPKPSSGSGFVAVLSKYTQGIIGGVITALMTASLMYFTMNNNGNAEVNLNQASLNQNIQNSNNQLVQTNTTDIPKVSSHATQLPKIIEKVIIKYVERPLVTENTAVSENTVQTPQVNENTNQENSYNLMSNLQNSPIDRIFTTGNVNVLSAFNNDDMMNAVISKPLDIFEEYNADEKNTSSAFWIKSIEFTGADYWMTTTPAIKESTNPVLDDNRLALFFVDFPYKLKLGLEFRQEYYYYEYSDINNTYQQHNNYLNASVVLRRILISYGMFSLYGQIAAGINLGDISLKEGAKVVGPSGRLMLGTIFSPADNFSFILGFEVSRLYYIHDNKDEHSNKIGLHYGIMYNF